MSTAFKSSSSPWMWVSFHLSPHPFLLFWKWSYLLCVCSSRLVMRDNNADECQVSFTWLCLQDPPENLCQIYVRKWLVAFMLTTWGLCTAEVFCHCFFPCRDFKVLLYQQGLVFPSIEQLLLCQMLSVLYTSRSVSLMYEVHAWE